MRASSAVSTRTTSPLNKRTVGPSIVSTGAIPAAFPGRSTFIWVPAAMKSSINIIVAGLMPAAAKLVFLPLPYLSLNPPGLEGYEKTGLPAIRS
ncbi:Uncharacterised protein [uncultured archaeon]|nr:Uncharacterised protein [uncultured archaeon]